MAAAPPPGTFRAELCGRYSLIAAIGDLEGLFDFVFGDTDYTPSYNIAPTQRVLTVVGAMPRRGGFMRWGLTPRSRVRGNDGYAKVSLRGNGGWGFFSEQCRGLA